MLQSSFIQTVQSSYITTTLYGNSFFKLWTSVHVHDCCVTYGQIENCVVYWPPVEIGLGELAKLG